LTHYDATRPYVVEVAFILTIQVLDFIANQEDKDGG